MLEHNYLCFVLHHGSSPSIAASTTCKSSSMQESPVAESLMPLTYWARQQDPAGIFELIEVVGNGTYGQVYKNLFPMARVTEDYCTTQGGRNNNKKNKQRLGSGECGQHPCPPENPRACRKGPVQHEFDVDVSGDSRVQWSDETRQLPYVLASWEDL
ncbi:hypothetical protein TNCV_407881 [Trichonephila clavipes]|nr:hypothetical protein TNCV_407881 [Trichonephila clavipes]